MKSQWTESNGYLHVSSKSEIMRIDSSDDLTIVHSSHKSGRHTALVPCLRSVSADRQRISRFACYATRRAEYA